mmetsp:Transcript_77397/g.234687  ORF Transcript_77397/g.234687 Transcript_77397/m.234687 type:complete len:222 (+) Transcript_77397:91-756(+)
MEAPSNITQAPSAPPRRPPRPSAAKPPVAPGANAVASKRRPPPLQPQTLSAGQTEGTFDISTPQAELTRHFIGTPNAAGILSAFLDFDEVDAVGPPLDPDYAALNSASTAPLVDSDNAILATAQDLSWKPGQGEDSASCSTGLSPDSRTGGRLDELGINGEESDEEVIATTGEGPPRGNLAEAEEEYEEDFEAESEGDDDSVAGNHATSKTQGGAVLPASG